MGSNADLFLFDHERYRSEVVPALVQLLRGGEVAPWLERVFRSPRVAQRFPFTEEWPRLVAYVREQPVDLVRYCTWLGEDLRYSGGRPADRLPRDRVACDSLSCAERTRCLFHETGHAGMAEIAAYLHQALVEMRCLGPSQFLGRTLMPSYYDPVLHRQCVADDDPLWDLFAALGRRGAVLGYVCEASSGTYGWLTAAETADLAARLARLDLPAYESTFPAMFGFQRQWQNTDVSAYEWPEVSLSFVRTVATVAAGAGQGVLWGGDVFCEAWGERL